MRFVQLAVGPMSANCYLVACEETGETCCIDPGGDVERVMEKVMTNGWTVKLIVNTHGHVDHIGGNHELARLTGAPIAIHQDDAEMLTRPELNLSFFTGGDPIEDPPADRLLSDGDVIRVGQIALTVIHTPGHTPGGICLLTGATLFSGDSLFAGSVGRTDFPGGSTAELINAIHGRILTLPDETEVWPGHGSQTTVGEERRANPFL